MAWSKTRSLADGMSISPITSSRPRVVSTMTASPASRSAGKRFPPGTTGPTRTTSPRVPHDALREVPQQVRRALSEWLAVLEGKLENG